MAESIHQRLKRSGAVLSSHYSDLYVKDSLKVREIIETHDFKHYYSEFISNIDGERWLDLPFANDDYWQRKQVKTYY